MAVEITVAFRKLLMPTQSTYKADEIYSESVTLSKKQQNLFMYGDGNSKTIVPGTGFIAKSVGFVNTTALMDTRLWLSVVHPTIQLSSTAGSMVNKPLYATVIIQSSTLIVRKSNNNVEKYVVTARSEA
ncbi:hypothetical protein Patl1_19382 [Pistacia atlantica]|uniref:Uncharacterized protein n=1 Tax=Pistacia atlantica TaxID=434234 RepID=A0ACC1C0D4_9ROSI|nr:hypothetical protein Patl1_19382 [Pistacia atlantica]